MVEVLIELELNVKAVLDTHFHLHLGDCLGLLSVVVVVHDCKINFLGDCGFHVPVDEGPDEIPDPTCDSIKSFVFFFEVGELEVELSVFSKNAGRFKFFGERVEFS